MHDHKHEHSPGSHAHDHGPMTYNTAFAVGVSLNFAFVIVEAIGVLATLSR